MAVTVREDWRLGMVVAVVDGWVGLWGVIVIILYNFLSFYVNSFVLILKHILCSIHLSLQAALFFQPFRRAA